ncbi:hypothetical protein [Endozoicomonas sp.]|uniref:hypothetical protein n=1 Tax=Endozoicomonas sp. TaxID=1892382 RepID=UPI00383B4D92
MSIRSIRKRSKTALQLFLAILISHPQLNLNAGEPPASTSLSHNYSLPIDYRHMALYQLKLNRYYHPSGSGNPNSVRVDHSHHHRHWGWWDVPFFWGGYGYTNHRDSSFSDRVTDGLIGAAVVVAVVAIAAAAIYSVSHAIWPYTGAVSLTSIEIPENSPWKITGYKTAHGGPIRYSDLAFNEDAMANAREHEMFDHQKNPQGRFLLVDQENWWGVVDYPVDIDVTFSRFDELSTEAHEQITVNFKRTVTNGLKAGAISSRIIQAPQNQQNYQLATRPYYPDWFDFSSWYHKPAQLMVDFKSTGYR